MHKFVKITAVAIIAAMASQAQAKETPEQASGPFISCVIPEAIASKHKPLGNESALAILNKCHEESTRLINYCIAYGVNKDSCALANIKIIIDSLVEYHE
jgi:hypothetical protein